MRGRGTRTADHIQKQKFVIYDFFGNHEYFNDNDTDIFTGIGRGGFPSGERKPTKPPVDLVELGLEDEWLHAVTYVEVGTEGERVDKRDYVTNWEKSLQSAVRDDPIIQKVRSGELLTEDEEKTLAERLNRPEMYFNEENLRRAYRQPGGNLIDFIKAALGSLKIKPREEELTENFQAWLVAKSLTPNRHNTSHFSRIGALPVAGLNWGICFSRRFPSLTPRNSEWSSLAKRGLRKSSRI